MRANITKVTFENFDLVTGCTTRSCGFAVFRELFRELFRRFFGRETGRVTGRVTGRETCLATGRVTARVTGSTRCCRIISCRRE